MKTILALCLFLGVVGAAPQAQAWCCSCACTPWMGCQCGGAPGCGYCKDKMASVTGDNKTVAEACGNAGNAGSVSVSVPERK